MNFDARFWTALAAGVCLQGCMIMALMDQWILAVGTAIVGVFQVYLYNMVKELDDAERTNPSGRN